MADLISLDFENAKKFEAEKQEDTYTRLCRLAATASSKGLIAITDTQKYFFSQKGLPYESKDGTAAFIEFQQLCKQYQRERIVGSAMGLYAEKTHIAISPSYITLLDPAAVFPNEEKPDAKARVDIVMGDLHQSLSQDQMMARDVSNILTVYTSCEKVQSIVEEKVVNRMVVKTFSPTQVSHGLLITLNAEKVRRVINFPGMSNISTRDALLLKLTGPLDNSKPETQNRGKAIIYMLMHELASSAPEKWVSPMPQAKVKLYNQYKPLDAPIYKTMVQFHYSKFAHVHGIQDFNKIWMTYLMSRQVTGGGREGIFSGYSLIDTMPGASKQYEEAMDIVNCAHRYGYTAIRLMQANIVLSNLLVATGFSVYCVVNGRGIHKDGDDNGIYHSGTAKTMIWFHNTQRSPEIKGKVVNFPSAPQFYDENTFMYVYIPSCSDKSYCYLPSMRAASGLCIMTNVISNRFVCTIPELLARFYTAQLTRAQFIFFRITFPAIDSMSKFFTKTIVVPRTGEGEEHVASFEALTAQSGKLVLNKDVAKKWQDSGKLGYLDVSLRAGLVDPAKLPESGVIKTVNDYTLEFTMKVQKLTLVQAKELFRTVAAGKSPTQLNLQECVSSLQRAKVLRMIEAIHKFENNQKIDNSGNVVYTQPTFWPHLKEKKKKEEEKPPPLPKEILPAEEEGVGDDPYLGADTLIFHQVIPPDN